MKWINLLFLWSVFGFTQSLNAQGYFSLDVLHPLDSSFNTYEMGFSSSALDGYDTLDVLDSTFSADLDIKGFSFEIDSVFQWYKCTNLIREVQAVPNAQMVKSFFFYAKSDTSITSTQGQTMFFLKFDSSDIDNMNVDSNFVLTDISIQSNDSYLWAFGNTNRNLYFFDQPSGTKYYLGPFAIPVIEGPFFPWCDSKHLFRLDVEYSVRLSPIESQFPNRNFNISIFPNPVKDLLNIEVNSKPSRPIEGSIHLFDVNGREVLSQPLKTSNESLDFSALPPGIYFAKIEVNGVVGYRKQVKK